MNAPAPHSSRVTPTYDPADAALALVHAWQEGRQLSALPEDQRPRTLAEGYTLQDAFVQAIGDRTAGWKLGAGSANAMQAAGLDRPVVGRLLAGQCQHHEGEGETVVRLRCAAPVTVEFEISVKLGRDIAPGTAPADPLRAVASVHPSFELVQSRFTDRRAVGWPSFVGDNVGFAAHIIGAAIPASGVARLLAGLDMQYDDASMPTTLGDGDQVDLAQSLRHLFDHAADRNLTLRAGEVISAGVVARPFDMAPGPHTVAAVYPGASLRLRVAVG